MNDSYLLIANHIKDLHHLLSEKIKSSRTHSPKWIVTDGIVEEIVPFLALANLLDKLGGNYQNSSDERLMNLEQSFSTLLNRATDV